MKQNKLGSKKWFVIMTLASLISMGVYASVTYRMGELVDFATSKNLDAMIESGKVILITVFVTLILNIIKALATTTYNRRALENMKQNYVDRVLNLNITQVQRDKVPAMLSQITNGFDRYESKFIDKLIDLVGSLSQFITSTVLLGFIHPTLVLAALLMLIIFGFVSSGASKPIKATEAVKTKSLNKYTEYINETFLGFEIIKQHQMETSREEKFMDLAVQVQKDNYQVDKKSTHVEAFNGLTINMVLYSVVIVGMFVASNASMSLGNVIVIFTAFSNIMWPIRSITPLISEMSGITGILDDMDKTLEIFEDSRELSIDTFESIQFEAADLGYEDGVILSQVNISIRRGEKVLIIGPSGAGKSTILKTLRQTIQPSSGTVTMNGVELSRINADSYYSKYSIVDQIGFLFDGTIRDNITLYQDRDDGSILNILRDIGLGDMALDSAVINDGNNMSGGQRARIMLARALSLNADIIMCDEIFASLDLDIAKAIEKDMLQFNNTIINVSHIMFEEHLELYDKIYIVDKGEVYLANHLDEVKSRMIEYM